MIGSKSRIDVQSHAGFLMGRSEGLSFRLLGFPVLVRPSFFFTMVVLAAASGWTTGSAIAIWAGVAFVAVLWHELGHAFACKRFGLAARIELQAMGGLTLHDSPKSAWKQPLIISLAGPIFGLVLGAAIWTLAHFFPTDSLWVDQAVHAGLWTNVGWSVINLLPILPYDGGHSCQALLDGLTGGKGALPAQVISLIVSGTGLAVALFYHYYFAAYLAGAACFRSYGAVGQLRARRGLDDTFEKILAGNSDAAFAELTTIKRSRIDEATRAQVAEQLIWVALHRADLSGARAAIAEFPAGYQPSPLVSGTLDALEGKNFDLSAVDPQTLGSLWSALVRSWIKRGSVSMVDRLVTHQTAPQIPRQVLHQIDAELFSAGQFEFAARMAGGSFELHHHPEDAYNAACALARMNEATQALKWLGLAIDSGYRDEEHLKNDPDLLTLRELPGFKVQLDRIGAR